VKSLEVPRAINREEKIPMRRGELFKKLATEGRAGDLSCTKNNRDLSVIFGFGLGNWVDDVNEDAGRDLYVFPMILPKS